MNQKGIGVILLNLGGPERLADVRPFLFNLFSDRKIIRLGPKFLQKPIAWWIARQRAPKSRAAYKLIGEGSPLNRITAAQGRALEQELKQVASFKVTLAMRYWRPTAQAALAELTGAGIDKAVALTLYPHYSAATTGSSLDDLQEAAADMASPFTIQEISSWPEHPGYIACLAGMINKGMAQFAGAKVQLVYSAHSLPVKFIEEGDPYLEHLKKTIQAVEKQTGISGKLCFQSRSGPVQWLSPSTPEMLEQLAGQGVSNVLVVPVSFVSDHVETLYEIDIQYRQLAASLGLNLQRTESLNVHPGFIAALRDLVLESCRAKAWLPV